MPHRWHTKPPSPHKSMQTHLAVHVVRDCTPQMNHGRGPMLTCGVPNPYLLPGTGGFICLRWLLADRFAPWLDGKAGYGGYLQASAPSSQERSASSYPFFGCPLHAPMRQIPRDMETCQILALSTSEVPPSLTAYWWQEVLPAATGTLQFIPILRRQQKVTHRSQQVSKGSAGHSASVC